MSRTHLIERTNTLSTLETTPHQMHSAFERAHANGTQPDNPMLQPFNFDLLAFAKDIQTDRLRAEIIGGIVFSADANIAGALSRMLNEFYQHSKRDPSAPEFASYQDFLTHVEGYKAQEEALYEAGLEVKPRIAEIHNLMDLREEAIELAASQLRDPTTYVASNLHDFVGKPTMRALSAANELDLMEIAKDEAGDNVDLQREHFEQLKLEVRIDRMNDFNMAKKKAEALVMLLACVSTGYTSNVNDESDAFSLCDPTVQFRMLNSAMRRIIDTRRKMVLDNRLRSIEKSAMRLEVTKSLVPQLTAALAHPIFTDMF